MKFVKRICPIFIVILILSGCKSKESASKQGLELNVQGKELLSSNPEKALSKFLKAEELNPETPEYKANAGIAYMALNRNEEALQKFKETIQLDPKYLQAYYNQGVILESLGNHEDAINSYKAALQIAPDSPEIVYNLALAHEKSGQDKEAAENYSRFIVIAPQNLQPAIEEAKSRLN
ncbi:tetratricopeptide repeat protein [Leptospira fainei serovar Hurstbridge str. BUT 6]|uniref:Tetratricopeptide repeat protein n=1 Tax=Leptospira fainei serovar Hurstbridge str. BUT 6 TaxID=1193011 RepID=S3UY40_9LEPT|nr:tetratricopeptide repeat protein [Leptospira fainei serovar Hurstbridge str. BUT 6]